ncbi:MAG: two-component regulator propeller domain-containing protein, partial [Bacteroidota bacterium]
MKLLVICCMLLSTTLVAQDEIFNFRHLALEEGLSQLSVTCIIKDSKGFMWFGTEDGLNKYDGNKFTVYQHQPDKPESISDSYINTIIEDDKGAIWIGTNNGLNRFNPKTETFTKCMSSATRPGSLPSNHINTIFITRSGQLLIGTSKGLLLYKSDDTFLSYHPYQKMSPYSVIAISEDSYGYLWVLTQNTLDRLCISQDLRFQLDERIGLEPSIKYSMLLDSSFIRIGTHKGLLTYDIKKKTFEKLLFYKNSNDVDQRNSILSIVKQGKDSLLLGTLEGGVIMMDTSSKTYRTIVYDANNPAGLRTNAIKSIYLDESDLLWIGTYGQGICQYDPGQLDFRYYTKETDQGFGLSERSVRAILEDRDGELWIGTHEGLIRFTRNIGTIRRYQSDSSGNVSISSNAVRALKEDSNGMIWAGTWSHGLNSFDKHREVFTQYTYLPGETDPLGPVRAIEIGKHNEIWIGGNGLRVFNAVTGENEKVALGNQKEYGVYSLLLESEDLLWIGTYENGLLCLNTETKQVKQYLNNPEDPESLSYNHVTSIQKDTFGNLWVGTYGGGLNTLDRNRQKFKRYNTSTGLKNNVIYGVLPDDSNDIWISSNAGISRLQPISTQVSHFGQEQGIQIKEFNAGAYFQSESGELFFGGTNGLISFFPDSLYGKRDVEDLVFTHFEVPMENETLSAFELFGTNISYQNQVTLDHDQNNLILTFSELNYSHNQDNTYEYQLSGLSQEWIHLGKERSIAMGNLNPGEYTLTVRVREAIQEKTSLKIWIHPPIWKSHWAYVFYAICLSLTTLFVYRKIQENRRLREQFELKIKNLEGYRISSHQKRNRKTIDEVTTKADKPLSIEEKFLLRITEIVENHLTDSSFDVQRFADEIFMSRSQLYRKLKKSTGYSTTEFIRLIRLKRAAELLSKNTGNVSEIAYRVGFDNV